MRTGPRDERFGVGTDAANPLSLATGDQISWTGSGTFDLAEKGLSFAELTQGSGTGDAFVGTVAGELRIVSTQVPEPASLGIFAIGLLILRRYKQVV